MSRPKYQIFHRMHEDIAKRRLPLLGLFITPTPGVLSVINDGTKTTFQTLSGDYIRFGDAITTERSLNTNDDVLVTGELEVGQTIYVNNAAADAYVSLDSGDNAVAGNKGLAFYAAADEDVEIINLPNTTGTPRFYWYEAQDAWAFTTGMYLEGLVSIPTAGGTSGLALADDVLFKLGNSNDAMLTWETADANANLLMLRLPTGGATNVPVFALVDPTLEGTDLGLFNGVVEPTVAIFNAAGDAHVSLDAGDDSVASAKGLAFYAAADEDIEIINLTNTTGVPRMFWDESEHCFAADAGLLSSYRMALLADNAPLYVGAGKDWQFYYSSADTDARALILACDLSADPGDNANILILTEEANATTNFGFFATHANDGFPRYAVVDTDADSYITCGFEADDVAWLMGGGNAMVNIDLNESIPTDQKHSGLTCAGVLGATIAVGELCYLANADGRWELADADAVATSGDVMLGICLVAGNDGSATTILLQGFYRDDTAFNFASPGDALYVSTTLGDMTLTAPSASGDVVRVVGYAHDDADTIYFNPSNDWIEIA